MAGSRLKGRIGRITGVDPAGPTFKYVSNEFRLDRTDAKFVDIVSYFIINIDQFIHYGSFSLCFLRIEQIIYTYYMD